MHLTANDIKRLFLAGAHALNREKDLINELNVFPVPDGDTGTNMTMTIVSSAKEVLSDTENSMQSVTKAISSGALRGARGNSGVILSQLFRGFCKAVRDQEKITTPDVVRGFSRAVDSAYKAVMKPKEGTILTVAKGMAERAEAMKREKDLTVFLDEVISYGEEVLARTPELLPVLKQAGVVDSGGKGLMVFMHGMADALKGAEVDMSVPSLGAKSEETRVNVSDLETSDIKFGYCTEYIILLHRAFTEQDEREYKAFLESIGDSIVCVADEEVVKTHVHTNDPGLAIQRALTYGELTKMKIDNMREEHRERLFQNTEQLAREQKEKEKAKSLFNPETAKEVGFIAVSAGDGIRKIMEDLEIDCVISGGQTMNPSTEDFLSALGHVNAKTVFIFPNNGNIIMAANQASVMTKDRQVIVIPTKTVPEGITAKINYDPEASVPDNTEMMTEMAKNVRTIEVTYAVRDTMIDDKEIHTGDFMALSGKHILSCDKALDTCVKQALSEALSEGGADAFVSVYYGSDVTEEAANALKETLEDALNGADCDFIYGGQPVYSYLISIERF